MRSTLLLLIVVVAAALAEGLQCKDPNGQPVDWFTAIKLPNLKSNVSDGTSYIYMDTVNTKWTFLTGITTEKSAIGHTVSQMYASSDTYNNSIMWITYNDHPFNGREQYTLGHTKGTVMADKDFGFWLVHSVPMFPQLPYQKNSYSYPKTGVLYGQSFLCVSMMAQELDKVGNQIINNEAYVYGSHFGGNLKSVYPILYNSTSPHDIPSKDNDGVRLQNFQSINGSKFLSVSKNRHFGKDLYHDLITNLTKTDVYTETWLRSADAFNSNCSGQFKYMAIKLPKLNFGASDGTEYIYLDSTTLEWLHLKNIMGNNSAIGQTVSQMYTETNKHNSIMWLLYNDEPTNHNTVSTMGHSKGIVMGDNKSGFWLVHSTPKFPQLPDQENSYSYPNTALKYGQNFLCISMFAKELDNIANQLINNEVYIYGSHFNNSLTEIYQSLYDMTITHTKPFSEHNGVRLQKLYSTNGVKFLTISKNRSFKKDIYGDLLAKITRSNLYTETWLNSRDSYGSHCSIYNAENIKWLDLSNINGLNNNYKFKSTKDHSKWAITVNSAMYITCIGDINRAHHQTMRGGGLVCMNLKSVWKQYKKLVLFTDNCA